MQQRIEEFESNQEVRIDQFSNTDAYNFLVTKARDREFELSQVEVNALLDKSLQYVSEQDLGGDSVFNLIESVAHDSWQFEDGKEFLVERIWRALPQLASKYPEVVGQLENFIGQQYFVRPEIFLDVAADVYSDKQVDTSFRDRILHSFNYQFTFGSDRYDNALAKSLDFVDSQNFERTGKFLDFYRYAFALSQGSGYSEGRSVDFVKILKEAVESKKGSYLLNIRAEGLLQDMNDSEEGMINRGYDKLPFLLAPGIVAIRQGDDVVVMNDPVEAMELRESILDVERRTVPTQAEIDAALKAGERSVRFSPSRELVNERAGLYQKLRASVSRGTRLEDLDIFCGKNSSEIRDYEFLLNPNTQQRIKTDFGFELSKLSASEQFEFLNFLKEKDCKAIPMVQDFTSKFGIEGLRLFMLRDVAGKDFGDELVSVVERVGAENAQIIVSKCSQILAEINYFDAMLTRSDGSKDMSKVSNVEVSNKVRTKILNKVFGLFYGSKDRDSAEQIIKNLENISAEAVLMQSMVMAGKEAGGVTLNDLPDIDLFTGAGSTLSAEQVSRIKEIYALNYATRPGMREKLLADLDVSIGKEGVVFHTLYFKGELVGVVVFEYNGDQVYFGKFNIDPKFQGGRIGEQLMEETLDRISQTHIVSATCSKGAPVTPKYIERGFVADGEFSFEEDECFNIVRNDSMNAMFSSKSMGVEDILKHADLNNWESFNDGRCQVLMTDYKNMNHLKLPMIAQTTGEDKWVVTRFFKHAMPNRDSVAVVVVERVDKNMFNKFKTTVEIGAASSDEMPLAA
jgi:GNAT superfamily N-acetyltransferase